MLEKIKILLGFGTEETDQDERLNLIIENTSKSLCNLLGGITLPEELQHIVVEVSVIRFNRIGSEGLSSHTVEGESQSFQECDFDSYQREIDKYLDKLSKEKGQGKVRFL